MKVTSLDIKRRRKRRGLPTVLCEERLRVNSLKQSNLILHLPTVPVCCISILQPRSHQIKKWLVSQRSDPHDIGAFINVHVFGASVSHPGGTGSKGTKAVV